MAFRKDLWRSKVIGDVHCTFKIEAESEADSKHNAEGHKATTAASTHAVPQKADQTDDEKKSGKNSQ